MAARLERDLHPVAWWIWAIGLAAAATLTTNPLLLALLVAVAAMVVSARRSDHPWALSFRLYLFLGLSIVIIRVVFRIVFGGPGQGTVLVELPTVPLPDWVAGVRLFGPITQEALLAGLYDGLRLAAIVICIGAANSLANPKRLLKSVPPALYEIGTALVVAVTVFPQLADSARRVRAAQALRGDVSGRVGRLRRFLVPVLEDALERSLSLAAGMDARGYGRSGTATRGQRWTTGFLLLGALLGLCVGTYALLDRSAPRWLALPMLLAGVVVAAVGMISAGRRVERSRYRPDRWRPAEVAVAGCGVAVGAVAWQLGRTEPLVAYPSVSTMPYLSALALIGALVGLLPAVAAPPPRQPIATPLEVGA
ncbi:MAG: Transmembrane component CbrV of energizing module of predicted cobalamin ECF transporter [uncultured Nocardioides sp.]|uniref:Transmembrane component CbrV of energizing module of predicted cobalamin ECF transporter n=1 Tax=uncultured Nocardioides sp. TaxID=198441 RepID=A0A6J4P406_9ACTN|nr:MAG: Transmembrane component CbrV of energizing module of predicted cobalamin ECF transporter [uncultured Nocardioides sp.]